MCKKDAKATYFSPMSISLEELHFLASDLGQQWIAECAGLGALALSNKAKGLPMQQRRALSEYLALLPKIKQKFQTDQFLLLDALAYEQSTAADLSKWKAGLVPDGARVADLCCGLGADSLFLADTNEVLGVDLSPERCAMFAHNLARMRPSAVSGVVRADVTALPLRDFDLWFCDPDRRGGERHGQWDPSQMRPNFIELGRLLELCPRAMLKLPPSTEFSVLPWTRARYSYIGDRKSCRELLVEIDPTWERQILRAVHVESGDVLEVEEGGLPPMVQGDLAEWIYEPSPVAIRSRLFHLLARDLGLWALDPHIAYLTGSVRVESPFLESFRVLESLAFDKKALKKALSKWEAGEVVVKKRGVEINPDALSQELRGKKGGQTIVVLVTRIGPKIVAILAVRA